MNAPFRELLPATAFTLDGKRMMRLDSECQFVRQLDSPYNYAVDYQTGIVWQIGPDTECSNVVESHFGIDPPDSNMRLYRP